MTQRCTFPCEYAPCIKDGDCRHCHCRPATARLVLDDNTVAAVDTVEHLLVRCFNGEFEAVQQGAATNSDQRLTIVSSFFPDSQWPGAAYVITSDDGDVVAAIVPQSQ